jgi:hypothetical protein
MRRSRLLIVLPAVGALVFTGLAPASADSSHSYGKVSAKVVEIHDKAKANDRGSEVTVRFEYRCTGNDDDIRTRVVLRQDGDRLAKTFEGGLECNGHKETKKVKLSADRGVRVANGDARVTVRFVNDRNGKVLDKERERDVEVRGVRKNR